MKFNPSLKISKTPQTKTKLDFQEEARVKPRKSHSITRENKEISEKKDSHKLSKAQNSSEIRKSRILLPKQREMILEKLSKYKEN